MPALPQSNLQLDILMGRDETIEPVDIFGGEPTQLTFIFHHLTLGLRYGDRTFTGYSQRHGEEASLVILEPAAQWTHSIKQGVQLFKPSRPSRLYKCYHGGLFAATPSLFKTPCSTTFLALTTHPSSNGIPAYAKDPQTQMPGPPSAPPSSFPAPCKGPNTLPACPAHCHHRLPSSLYSPINASLASRVSTALSNRATLKMLSFFGGTIGFVV